MKTMNKILFRILITGGVLLVTAATCFSQTIVFYEKDFPSAENGAISHEAIEKALNSMNPRFVGLAELRKANLGGKNSLLVLPYGSAFPADAWETIQKYLENGNLLILGGRPFSVPVYHDSTGWRMEQPQDTYARHAGIEHTYEVPRREALKLQWHEDALSFSVAAFSPGRVFTHDVSGERYRGLASMVDAQGNRISSPIAAQDFVGFAQTPRRRVYLSFESGSSFWDSHTGIDLIRQSAAYASHGGVRLWFDLAQLTIDPGGSVSGAVDVLRNNEPAELLIELLSGTKVLASRKVACGSSLHEEIGLIQPLKTSGFYTVRATLSIEGKQTERYTSGVFVRDLQKLHSGEFLEAGRDYFKLGGKPYLMTGANYFCTDPYTAAFFVGSSLGGNPYVWDQDFTEMAQQGFTAVRTGIWLNRSRYLDDVSGAAGERLLRGIEAFLYAARSHNFQVIFTFFAFDPQTELQQGPGQTGNLLGPGSNPYLDPVAIAAQLTYLRTIVSRFRDVPYLSYDLINEPSFNNPKRPWKGNSPNADPNELAAWKRWLEKRYVTPEKLAKAWNIAPAEMNSFEKVQIPNFADLELVRSGNRRTIRAVDFNLFAQESFRYWVDTLIHEIRIAGSRQAITVGQDEGGVADRLLNQFWGQSQVTYTVNHSWWRDDALLWNSVAAKTLGKPNLIGETGPQPVLSMNGAPRWDDIQGTPLLERKLVLAFANAGAGVLHWDWTRAESFGLLRRDGSYKLWMDVMKGISLFARDAQAYVQESKIPDIALVLPQSLQLSPFNHWGLAVQQNAVRALYNYTRTTAFAVGEYQLSTMADAKLIIVPAPWVLHQEAWEQLMMKVNAGATLLISGRIDADEHWKSIPERLRGWKAQYTSSALITREVEMKWPGDSARLTYSDNRTTYAERGVLQDGSTFLDVSLGSGHIFYFALPLELADQLDVIGRIYSFAIKSAGATSLYETSCKDPGILICPTRLHDATLYVLTSESASADPIEFRDLLSNTKIKVHLAPGRGALMLVGRDGKILASYNTR
jgi:hypothetical protein